MALSVDQLGRAIVAAGLMPADELKALWSELAPGERPKDDKAFAGLLVRQGKLTTFQAEALLNGSPTPLVLGDYILLSKIGAGGMGQVFKAQHRHMERLVAVKLLPAEFTKNEATVKRFQREVKAAARLSHPNIVAALDARYERGVWCLVMEYVEGRDLSELSKEIGPLGIEQAADYILQASRGLAYAHGEGVIHRDIKPANLLLDKKGVVKILDMGLARFDSSGDAEDRQLTNTGQVMGTVDYMAPEQATNTHNADARSDVYALGCSLYRLLVGEGMFGGQTAVEKILKHINEPIPSLCEKRPDAPPELDRIFRKMVAKQPADRYQRTTELLADLEEFVKPGASAAALPAALNPGAPEQDRAYLSSDGAQVAQKTQTKTALEKEQTIVVLGSESATAPANVSALPVAFALAAAHGSRSGRGAAPKSRQGLLIAGGLGGAGLLGALILLGIWVIVRDKHGNEVARIKVPVGGNVVVQDDPKSAPASSSAAPPSNTPAATNVPQPPASPEKPVVSPPVSAPGGPRPPPAVAPFDAAMARAHQEAWAKHLGVPVEATNSIGMKLALIPPGEFLMGAPPEEVDQRIREEGSEAGVRASTPQHHVRLKRPMYLGVYEVTQAEYEQVIGAQIASFAAGRKLADKVAGKDTSRFPVESLTWLAAIHFCDRLSQREGLEPYYRREGDKVTIRGGGGYRLPTEAEWEFACRAGTQTRWWFGNDPKRLPRFAHLTAHTSFPPRPVGQLPANPFGLHDLHGNIREFCWDPWDPAYYSSFGMEIAIDPQGPTTGMAEKRVVRDIIFDNKSKGAAAGRSSYVANSGVASIGFRIARTIEPDSAPPSAELPRPPQPPPR